MSAKAKMLIVCVSVILLLPSLGANSQGIRDSGQLGKVVGDFWRGWYHLQLGSQSEALRETTRRQATSIRRLLDRLSAPGELIHRAELLLEWFSTSSRKEASRVQPIAHWTFHSTEELTLHGAKPKSMTEQAWGPGFKFIYLVFSTDSDYALLPLGGEIKAGESFTVDFWLNPGKSMKGHLVSGEGWSLRLQEGGLQLHMQGSEGLRMVSKGSVPQWTWSHLAISFAEGGTELYLNGTRVARLSRDLNLRLGDHLKLGPGFVGAIDELRLYERPLSRTELHYLQPVEYLAIFPVLQWIHTKSDSGYLWGFYCGLTVQRLEAQASAQRALDKEAVSTAATILWGKREGLPPPPDSLPEKVQEALEGLLQLAKSSEWGNREQNLSRQYLNELQNFLQD